MRLPVFENRYADHTLTEEQQELQAAVRDLYEKRVPPQSLRENAGAVHPQVFAGLEELGVLEMAQPDSGADLTDLVAVAEAVGEGLGGIPLAEHWAATRLLHAAEQHVPDPAPDNLNALAFEDLQQSQLIAGAAAARTLVGVREANLARVDLAGSLTTVPDFAGMSLAQWDPAAHSVTPVTGVPDASTLYQRAIREWRILVSAMTLGAAATAIRYAVRFANQRETRGAPIGALQAISHSLADAHIGVVAGRNLTRRAAWYEEHEPGARPDLPLLAHVHAARAATAAVHTAVHVHGGQGVSLESDVTVAFERARQWPLAAGNPEQLLLVLGRALTTAGREAQA